MNRKKLSWEILILIGIILWFLNGIIKLVGIILVIIGVIEYFKNRKNIIK